MDERTKIIIEQSKIYAQKNHINDKEALAFIAGAAWADDNPEWVRADERLPAPRPGENYSRSVVCLCRTFNTDLNLNVITTSLGVFLHSSGTWLLDGGRVLERNQEMLYWKGIKLPKGLR